MAYHARIFRLVQVHSQGTEMHATILLGVAAFIMTMLGGLFALKFTDKLHLITGFSAGAIIGVAFFDLLPEAVQLEDSRLGVPFVSLIIAVGFSVYMVLDRILLIYSPHDTSGSSSQRRGALGAGSLSIHSFLDGLIMGLAFQISSSIGTIVAAAVLTHDFSDGINTVTLILRGDQNRQRALRWLLLDAVAPVLGVAATFFWRIPGATLGTVLSLFCGSFLYIGAADLLPESYHAHPKLLTTLVTLLGMAVLYSIIQLAK